MNKEAYANFFFFSSQNVKYFPASIFKESKTWTLKLPKYSLQIQKQKQNKNAPETHFMPEALQGLVSY